MHSLHVSFNSKGKSAIGTLLAILFLLTTGCSLFEDSEPLTPLNETEVNLRDQLLSDQANITIITGLTVDAEGNTVVPTTTDPATLLFYRRTGLPVLAPDGHQITAGEYAAVKGTAVAICLNSGAQVKLKLRNLIPNAIYRAWILTFKEPGFLPSQPNPFENLIGEGALGPNDRSRNTFKSSSSGRGKIVRIMEEGELSEFGTVGDCLLKNVYEWHVFVALQQPGQPYGTNVGPPVFFPETAVEQFGFVFK
jgi:hypothetical protein